MLRKCWGNGLANVKVRVTASRPVVIVYVHFIGVPQGSNPGPTPLLYGEYKGIKRMGSLPLGTGNFKRLFQNKRIGMGRSQHCGIMDDTHRDITGIFSTGKNMTRGLSQNYPTSGGDCQLCSLHLIIPLEGPGVTPGTRLWHVHHSSRNDENIG